MVDCDVLVVGGGSAGCRAAIEAAKGGSKVTLLSKGPIGQSGITPVAMEGAQIPCHPEDSPRAHFEDTVKAGRGLSDQDLVRVLARNARACLDDLESYGAKFKKREDGAYIQTPRPGQSFPRNCYLIGGGKALMTALCREMGKYPNILIYQDSMAIKLLCSDGRFAGAISLDLRSGQMMLISAKAAVIATGGYEELWPITDCPPDSTGDGHVLAYRAGARLIDLELVLYYPTVVLHPGAARGMMIQYEYLLNPDILNGRLLNAKGQEFIEGFPHRDVIVYSIYDEIKQGRGTSRGAVYFDLTRSFESIDKLEEAVKSWIPNQYNRLLRLGIDLKRQMIEVAPAAHFTLGGVKIEADASTNLPGLFAAGEAAANLQGANRMSGNAITETLVFGAVAGASASNYAARQSHASLDWASTGDQELARQRSLIAESRHAPGADFIRPIDLKRRLQKIMWEGVGPIRDSKGMKAALGEIESLEAEDLPRMKAASLSSYCYELCEAYEAEMMVELAKLAVLSALHRKESRGHHRRLDFPEKDDLNWLIHTSVELRDGQPCLGTAPVKVIRGDFNG